MLFLKMANLFYLIFFHSYSLLFILILLIILKYFSIAVAKLGDLPCRNGIYYVANLCRYAGYCSFRLLSSAASTVVTAKEES